MKSENWLILLLALFLFIIIIATATPPRETIATQPEEEAVELPEETVPQLPEETSQPPIPTTNETTPNVPSNQTSQPSNNNQTIVPKMEVNKTMNYGIWCTYSALSSQFLNRLVEGKFTHVFLSTAQWNGQTLVYSRSDAELSNFISQVKGANPNIKVFAWVWSHLQITPPGDEPNFSTVGYRSQCISEVVACAHKPSVGAWQFDGIQDDSEDWTTYPNFADQAAYFNELQTALTPHGKTLFAYTYHTIIDDVYADYTKLSRSESYNDPWDYAHLNYMIDTYNPVATSPWLLNLIAGESSNSALAQQLVNVDTFLDNHGGWSNFPKWKGFTIYWTVSMNVADWTAWIAWVNQAPEPPPPPIPPPPAQYYIVQLNNSNGGYTTPTSGTYQKLLNEVFTVTATAGTNYVFTNWTRNSEVVSTNRTYSFTSPVEYTWILYATFTYVPPPPPTVSSWTLTVSGTEGGSTNPAVGSHVITTLTQAVSAIALATYEFVRWLWDGTTEYTDNPHTFTSAFNQSHTLHAYFRLVYTPPPSGSPLPDDIVIPQSEAVSPTLSQIFTILEQNKPLTLQQIFTILEKSQ